MAALRYAMPSAYHGSWQAGIETPSSTGNSLRVTDQGHAASHAMAAIALDVRQPIALHALQVPCQLLFLQLKRYSQHSAGASKNLVPVSIQAEELLQLPVFDGCRTAKLLKWYVPCSIWEIHYGQVIIGLL